MCAGPEDTDECPIFRINLPECRPFSRVRMPDGQVYMVDGEVVEFARLRAWWRLGRLFALTTRISRVVSHVAGAALIAQDVVREQAGFPEPVRWWEGE